MDFFHKLLNFYHLDEKGYAELSAPFSFSDIPSISHYDCVQKAIARLELAKAKNERVLVYGDYDCDGIMAASIMKIALTRFGLKAEAYLPSRYVDGYGLTAENAEKISKSYSLIITVDNGVTANDAIEMAYKNNVDVIVLDHHSFEVPPEHIVSLIHPLTVGLDKPAVSAGFLSYLFSAALLGKQDPYLEMLGATSLLSDAMEIVSYNRKALGLALKLWKENGNPAFFKLRKNDNIDESVLAMQIIPTINSIGRMNIGTKINRLIKYFSEPNSLEAPIIAAWMLDVNKERKELVLNASGSIRYDESQSAVVAESHLPEGINGLLANKVLDQVKKPVAIYSPSSRVEGLLVGSIRSKEGCPLTDFYKEAEPLLVAGGGHAYAAGFSIKKEDLASFADLFYKYCSSHSFKEEKKEAIEISLEDINEENYALLNSFGPFGPSNPSPLFTTKVMADRLFFSNDGSRIQTRLSSNSRLFSFKYKKGDLPSTGELTLTFEMNANVFKGKTTISGDIVNITY